MPKLTKSQPTYRWHKWSGQAVVTLGGVDHYLGPYDSKSSRTLYDRLVGDWLARGRTVAPDESASDPLSIKQLLAAYWLHAEKYYRKDGRPSGEITPLRLVLRELRRLYGTTPANTFGPLKLRALQSALVAKGWTRKSINQQIGRVIRVFAWGVSVELVPSHIPEALREVPGLRYGRCDAVEGEPVQPVSDSVVEATLPHLPPTVAAMVRLQRLTGARPGEICSMRPCDIDRTGEVWVFAPAEHKTQHHGRKRVVAIGPKAQAVLMPFLVRAADSFCFSPADSERKRRDEAHEQRETPLSCGNVPGSNRQRNPKRKAGLRYCVHAYRRAIASACEKAFGFPDELRTGRSAKITPEEKAIRLREAAQWRAKHVWAPNQLRHSAATEIRNRFGLEAAQVTLGHANANVTQVYAERDLAKAIQVAREVG